MSERPASPYKGLAPFEDSALDVLFFFGRERERELIEANLQASRLTVLYGETGVGKSSVLRAGVAHGLRARARSNLEDSGEPEHAVVVFDAWRDDDPLAALRAAVADAVTSALGGSLLPKESPQPLADVLRVWQDLLGGDLYVILDQVEEYFLYHGAELRPGSFAAEFASVADAPDLRVNFLLAIREDALAKLDAFRGRVPNVLGNCLHLEHLDPIAARAAILGPVAEYNRHFAGSDPIEIEPGLVEAVLEQVVAGRVGVGAAGSGAVTTGNGSVRIETAYLQLVMHRLWNEERSQRSMTLRLETLRALGGAEPIVRDHVQRSLDALSAEDQEAAARMFDHLVTPSGSKIAHGIGDLATYAGTREEALVPVLTKLGGDRIVRSVATDTPDGSRYEIFHDVLTRPVLAWKADHETRRELERQRAESDRRHRRLLLVIAAGAVALVAMAGITVFALAQRHEARRQTEAARASQREAHRQAQVARASDLAGQALAQLGTDPQQSLQRALDSVQVRPSAAGTAALRQALVAARERAILPALSPVNSVLFSPEGSRVLTAADGGVRLWSPRTGRPVLVFRGGRHARAATFSPDGKLVLALTPREALVWRAGGSRLDAATLRHGAPLTSASFSADGTQILTTGTDGTARLWTKSGRPLQTIHHDGPVLGGWLSPDGRLLLTVSSVRGRRVARAFALPGGEPLYTLAAGGVTTAAFSRDGTRLITGGLNQAAIWDARSGFELHRLDGNGRLVTAVAFGPNGQLAVVASAAGPARVWNVRRGRRIWLLLGHTDAITDVAFSPDSRYLVTSSRDETARVWSMATGAGVSVLHGHTEALAAAAWSPDGQRIATASADGTARLWDPGAQPQLRVLSRARGPVEAAAFSADGQRVLTAGPGGLARILRPDGRLVRPLRQPSAVRSAVWSADGRLALTAGADGSVRAWRAADGKPLRIRRDVSPGPIALDRRGDLLAGPTLSGRVGVWSLPSLRPVRRVGSRGAYLAAALSPDGRLVAGAGADGAIRLWDARTGKRRRVLRGHHAAVTSVSFSPDGRSLVSTSRDHDVRIWDLTAGKSPSARLRGHSGTVFGASYNPDGHLIVSAGPTTAGVWDAANGRVLVYLRAGRRHLTSAAFSPDGRRILTSGVDGIVRVYECPFCGGPDQLAGAARERLAELARPLSPALRRRYLPEPAS